MEQFTLARQRLAKVKAAVESHVSKIRSLLIMFQLNAVNKSGCKVIRFYVCITDCLENVS